MPMRACCTAATWRLSNSLRVTIWPFTLATIFSITSARADAASSRLGTRARRNGFMIHLGLGHQALDVAADGRVGLAPAQQAADLRTTLLEAALALRLARLDLEH